MKKFWYVHNRAMGNPTVRHETKESAIDEAIRLSKMYNKNFYVLESSCKVLAGGVIDDIVEVSDKD